MYDSMYVCMIDSMYVCMMVW